MARVLPDRPDPGVFPQLTDALIAAIQHNDTGRVRDLLAAHPELSATLDRGTDALGFGATPLIAAVRQGNRDMIDALLAAGADINVKSDWWAGGFSVLDSADDTLVPFLLERGAGLDANAAAKFGMTGQLAELIAADPEAVHLRGGDGKTPLHWARDVPTARLLVEHGADVNTRDVDHESTPAQYAIGERQDVVRYLLSAGSVADIFIAAALGDIALARMILDRDASVVELTIGAQSFPMINPRAGGTIYIWTIGQGKSPQMVAHAAGHQEVFDLLMERTPDHIKLVQACLLGDEALFNQLSRAAPDLVARMPKPGQQLLDVAITNNTDAVHFMLRAGWPADARGPGGATPLHWAAWHGNVAMIRALLQHHAPIDAREANHHATPLGWALHGSVHGWYARTGDYAGAVTALLDAGARTEHVRQAAEGSDAAMAAYRAGPRPTG